MFATSKTVKYGQAVLSRNLTTSIVASQKKRDDALQKEFDQLNRGEFGGEAQNDLSFPATHRNVFGCFATPHCIPSQRLSITDHGWVAGA